MAVDVCEIDDFELRSPILLYRKGGSSRSELSCCHKMESATQGSLVARGRTGDFKAAKVCSDWSVTWPMMTRSCIEVTSIAIEGWRRK